MLKGRPKRSGFHFIIEKMQSRLASWKNKLLKKIGRLALATSILSSIPSYYMQINRLPQTYVTTLIKLHVILFGEVPTIKVSIWSTGKKFLSQENMVVWVLYQLGKPTLAFLENLFGIWFNQRKSFG